MNKFVGRTLLFVGPILLLLVAAIIVFGALIAGAPRPNAQTRMCAPLRCSSPRPRRGP